MPDRRSSCASLPPLLREQPVLQIQASPQSFHSTLYLIYPNNRLDYSSNFLRMMLSTPCEEYQVDPVLAGALDLLLILHADHEQNCSTSTVRLVGSSRADLFASI